MSSMQLKYIPEDINVELLLSFFPEGHCKVALKGRHGRNSYNDIVDVEERKDGSLLLDISRNSLYNSLPEQLFHPVDRFDNIPKVEEKERFAEEYRKQEQEKEDAYSFFAPFDLLLLDLRAGIRKRMNEYVESNKVLTDVLTDRLTAEQRANRFIRQALPFMPSCKTIRGDKTLLTLMLRKIFMGEGLKLEKHSRLVTYTDAHPRYADGLDATLGESYVGNLFDEETVQYDIHYWSEEYCDGHFLEFVDDVELFQSFIQDYFLSVEESLHFFILKDDAPLRLSDDIVFNFLNYNTNL